MATLPPDLREFCERFTSNKVEFLIVGAFAAIQYGVPRYTGDLDLWVRRTPENAKNILRSISEFGFGGLDICEDDFLSEDLELQLGRPPARIDILTFITGVEFDEVWPIRLEAFLDGIPVNILSKDELLKNKRVLGRYKDQIDVAFIEGLDQGQG